MNEGKPVMKRKWWLLALIVVGGLVASLVALVALAPTLVSAGLFRGSIESAIGGAVNGSARVGSLSLAWFGQQQVTGLELRDGKGETQIKLDLKLENGLFDLAFDPGTSAWDLRSDGEWIRRVHGPEGQPLRDYQETLIARNRRRGDA